VKKKTLAKGLYLAPNFLRSRTFCSQKEWKRNIKPANLNTNDCIRRHTGCESCKERQPVYCPRLPLLGREPVQQVRVYVQGGRVRERDPDPLVREERLPGPFRLRVLFQNLHGKRKTMWNLKSATKNRQFRQYYSSRIYTGRK
jgi:hypothetical protein